MACRKPASCLPRRLINIFVVRLGRKLKMIDGLRQAPTLAAIAQNDQTNITTITFITPFDLFL